MRTIADFEMMEPMRYYDNPNPKTDNLRQKRQDMIDNKADLYVASEKKDGDWGMFIHYSKGHNLIRSRSISKVTGKYGDMTEKLPHLAEEMDMWPDNSVVLAEICWNEYGTTANTVGTILRCLPQKAVERQKDKKLYALVFDVLMWDNDDLTDEPYIGRLNWLHEFDICNDFKYFKPTAVFYDNFAEEADRIISAGGEGIVIQLKSNKYMPGTRTAWSTLKMKQSLPHMDLKVVGIVEPERLYGGISPETWKYLEVTHSVLDENGWYEEKSLETRDEYDPNGDLLATKVDLITKYYYMGWKAGVVVDFNGVKVKVVSGVKDEEAEWLATPEAAEKIVNGELYAEVKAMSVNSQDSLRHPCLVRLRTDM